MYKDDILKMGGVEIRFEPKKPNIGYAHINGIDASEIIEEALRKQDTDSLRDVCFKLFHAAKILLEADDYHRAGYVVNLIFEPRFYYELNIHKERLKLMETDSYFIRLEITDEFEQQTGVKIHKGTPYAFLAEAFLLRGNLEWWFNFEHQAVEEDRRAGKIVGNPLGYQEYPAFKTISFLDDTANHMYPHIKKYILFLKEHLEKYNKLFNRGLTYQIITERFLKQEPFHDIKAFFTYTIAKIYELSHLPSPNLKENVFTRLAHLNNIFNLALVVDKRLKHSCGQVYIGGNVKVFCEKFFNVPRSDLEDIKQQFDLDKNLEQDLAKLLSLQISWNGNPLPPEAATLLCTWQLRNFGAHQIKSEEILQKEWDKIFSCLVNALFLAIDYLPIQPLP